MKLRYLSISISTCFSFFFLLNLNSYCQNTFVKRAGSVHSDYGVSCQPTFDNGIVLAVVTSTNGMDVHCGLVKTDPNGTVLWSKLFQIWQWTNPATVLQAKDEGYIVFGSVTDSAVLNYNHHYLFLHKTDLSGNSVWDTQFAFSSDDIAVNMVHRKQGGYIALATGDSNIGSYPSASVTRIAENGTIIWCRQFSTTYGMRPQKIVEMENGNICFVSYAATYSPSPFNDIIVTVLDTGGNQIWTKNLGTYYDDEPLAVASNSSNNIFITGRTYILNREWDTFILKLDLTGNILQSKFFDAGTAQGEVMRCIIARDDGTCTLLGDIGDFSERDITFINLDSNAQIASAKRYLFSTLFTNYPYEIMSTSDGGFVFTGDVRPPSSFRDAIIAKTDSDGNTYCFNSNKTFTTHNDSIYSIPITLSVVTPTINVRNDSSFIPNNFFNAHVDCAATTEITDLPLNGKLIKQFYPNPATGTITLETNESMLINRADIFSIEGKLVAESIFNTYSDNITLDLNSLSPGMYFIDIHFSKESQVIKVIKN